METSLLTWKHHYQVGNITIHLETSLFTWIKWKLSSSELCFQVNSDMSKLIRVSKLIITFPIYVIKLTITTKTWKPVPPAKTSHWTMVIDEIKCHGAVNNPFFAFKKIKKYFKFCDSNILVNNFLLTKPSIWCIGILTFLIWWLVELLYTWQKLV